MWTWFDFFALKIFLGRFWEILPVYYNMFWGLKRIIFGKAWGSVPWFRQCMHRMISMHRIWQVMFSLEIKHKIIFPLLGLIFFFGLCGVDISRSLSFFLISLSLQGLSSLSNPLAHKQRGKPIFSLLPVSVLVVCVCLRLYFFSTFVYIYNLFIEC